jgi:hypothetical protein
MRVLTEPAQPLGPTDFERDNVNEPLERERNYQLDFGGIDQQASPSPSPPSPERETK